MTRRRIKFDIYLRFYYSQTPRWPANTIVIARLGFQKTRKGNGTHFISFLKGIALKYDFEYISLVFRISKQPKITRNIQA